MSELFKFTLADAIGFAGAAAILFAFGANLTAKWRTTDVIYKLFNFGGATLVAYSLLCRPNLAALTVEILWAVISLIALMRPDRFEEESEPEERFLMSPLHWYGRWPLSLWHQSRERQRAIRQRRRAWRLLDAAANSVGALAQGVAAPPGAPVSAQTIAREISGIRHTLDDDALSCLSGNSSGLNPTLGARA